MITTAQIEYLIRNIDRNRHAAILAAADVVEAFDTDVQEVRNAVVAARGWANGSPRLSHVLDARTALRGFNWGTNSRIVSAATYMLSLATCASVDIHVMLFRVLDCLIDELGADRVRTIIDNIETVNKE